MTGLKINIAQSNVICTRFFNFVLQVNNNLWLYFRDAKNNTHKENGWGQSAYVVSKVGVSALTRIQQRDFDKIQNTFVNCVHPGYVDTDMTNNKGPLTIEEGAKAPLYLALEEHNLKGQYIWYDSTVVDWLASSAPEND